MFLSLVKVRVQVDPSLFLGKCSYVPIYTVVKVRVKMDSSNGLGLPISFSADEWRSKWFLENKWQKSTTQELIQAMSNINDHVRLAAVSACSKAAEIRRENRDVEQLGE